MGMGRHAGRVYSYGDICEAGGADGTELLPVSSLFTGQAASLLIRVEVGRGDLVCGGGVCALKPSL